MSSLSQFEIQNILLQLDNLDDILAYCSTSLELTQICQMDIIQSHLQNILLNILDSDEILRYCSNNSIIQELCQTEPIQKHIQTLTQVNQVLKRIRLEEFFEDEQIDPGDFLNLYSSLPVKDIFNGLDVDLNLINNIDQHQIEEFFDDDQIMYYFENGYYRLEFEIYDEDGEWNGYNILLNRKDMIRYLMRTLDNIRFYNVHENPIF